MSDVLPLVRNPGRSIILLYGTLTLGGIETLIARLAQALTNEGCNVTIMHTGGKLTSTFPFQVRSVRYSSWRDAFPILAKLRVEAAATPLHLDPIVVSFDPTSCALALWLIRRGALGPCTHVTGIYHPRAYFLEGEDRLREEINRMIFKVMPANALFFMNAECRDTHAAWSAVDLSTSPIIPLGVERLPQLWHPAATRTTLRIVSVGRLVVAKAYNLGAFRIVRKLLDQGVDVLWDIYGTGELEPDMRAAARELAVGDRVELRGDLPYKEFNETVARYDAFIGIGTAALEAAMIGMPTMMATDGAEVESYGFLFDLPSGNVGERQPFDPPFFLAEMLTDYWQLPRQSRIDLGSRCREAALNYDMHSYAKRLLAAGHAADRGSGLLQYLAGVIYRETTVGLTRKLVSTLLRPGRAKKRA